MLVSTSSKQSCDTWKRALKNHSQLFKYFLKLWNYISCCFFFWFSFLFHWQTHKYTRNYLAPAFTKISCKNLFWVDWKTANCWCQLEIQLNHIPSLYSSWCWVTFFFLNLTNISLCRRISQSPIRKILFYCFNVVSTISNVVSMF
jgi:hypothetical protein